MEAKPRGNQGFAMLPRPSRFLVCGPLSHAEGTLYGNRAAFAARAQKHTMIIASLSLSALIQPSMAPLKPVWPRSAREVGGATAPIIARPFRRWWRRRRRGFGGGLCANGGMPSETPAKQNREWAHVR